MSARMSASWVLRCNAWRRARPRSVTPAASSLVPIQNSFISGRMRAEARFEKACERFRSPGEGEHDHHAGIESELVVGRREQERGAGRDLGDEIIERAGFAQRAEIKRQEFGFLRERAERKVLAEPAEEAGPITADAEALRDDLERGAIVRSAQILQEPGAEIGRALLRGFHRPEETEFRAQPFGGMQPTERADDSARGGVAFGRDEIGGFAQADRREKKKEEPDETADVSGQVRPQRARRRR